MWIHSIRLLNFKSYKEAAFSFPEPKNGQNIVLIGAMNGHGKTTLLEAVYLCLYDTDAVSHLQRAGLNSKDVNYPNFLQAALHHKAAPQYGRYRIELEIEIRQRRQGKICGLKIRRKWHFNEKRQFERESTETRADVLVDNRYLPVDLAELDKYLNTYALPFDYAPFFFFDGEKIVQAAERSGTGMWLNTALKGLLGVTLLTRLAASLGDYRRRCISENAGQKMQEDLERAENALASAQAQYDVFREEWEKMQQEWAHWDSERSRLQQQLGGGSDIRTSQDLLMQRERLEKEMDDFNAKIKAAVKAMPLAFLPSDGLNVLKGKLEREANRLHHEAGREQIAGRVNDFWSAFVSSGKVKEVLGRSAGAILEDPLMKEAVAECWNELFYPLPDNCAEIIEHNYLSKNAHAEIQSEISRLQGMPQGKIGSLLADIEQRRREQKQVLEELELLKGSNKDELVEQLKQANEQADRFKERSGSLKSNVLQKEKECQRKKDEVSKLQDKISDSNPLMVKSRRAGQVEKVIAALTDALMRQKAGEIGETATRINRAIAHDDRIHKISIEADGRMGLYGRDGREAQVDLSAGQMQILIMSLVSALAEVTRYPAPFVIDTPLARLDEGHREGLFRHWSGLEQQVILLSQDTEITPEVYRRLDPHIGRTYLVEAESLDSAGASSRVTADVYFE
jgi:DNA sulfur modification protein dndD